MNLTAIFLLSACLAASAAGFSQRITLNEENVPVQKIFREIWKQSGFQFVYTDQTLKGSKPVTVHVKDARLEDVLQLFCFQQQPFTFTITDGAIVLKQKDPAPVFQAGSALSPPSPIDVHGRVTDSLGNPLAGATVSVKGSSGITVTDANGEFLVRGIPSNAAIVISSIGYGTQEIKLNGRTELDVHMRVKVNQMSDVEVVYSSGYQVISKERATGSFAFVDNKLFNRRVAPDVLSRLEGVVPGLLVNRNVGTTNNPNGVDISIRGYSTLFSNAQPLIVVDNFPYDGNIQNINPNDVESVTVLKDAAAASIWGARSGNGVIVITTKKGRRNQKLQVEANANTTVSARPDLFYDPNFLDSRDFIDVEQQLFSKGYYDAKISDPNHTAISPVVQLLADQRAGNISAADATQQIDALKNADVRNDLNKYFYRQAVQQQYSLGLRGGGLNSDYSFSAGYDKGIASQVGNGNNRLTLSSNFNFYPVEHLVLSVGDDLTSSGIQTNSPLANLKTSSNYQTIYPYAQLADASGNALAMVKDYNYSWATSPAITGSYLDWTYKPLNELRSVDNTTKLVDNRLNFGLKYSFLPGLDVNIKYLYEKANTAIDNYSGDSSYYARNLVNQYTNLSSPIKYPIPAGGILSHSNSTLTSQRARAQLDFNHNWNHIHNIAAIAGAEISQAVNEGVTNATMYGYNRGNGTSQNVNFATTYTFFPALGSGLIPNQQGVSKTTDRYISYFGNLAYTWLERYTLSASGRIDKSNLFGVSTNQKSNPLFSTGVSWEVNKENFYHISWLPYLKFRATYGYNGNINKSVAAVTTTQQLSASYYFGLPLARILNSGNPQLRWEKIKMINWGVDFALKGNILSGSFEYYLKKGIDLFGSTPLAPSSGLTSFYGNTANSKGSGFDLVLNAQPVRTRHFSWTVNYLLSRALDRVTKYDAPYTVSLLLAANAVGGSIAPQKGKPVFSVYSYQSGPLTHNTGDPQGYLGGHLSTDYANIIRNTTDVNNLVSVGTSRPTVFGSLRNNFSYQSFTFSFNVVYKFNYYFRRSSIFYNGQFPTFGGLFSNWAGHADYTKRWMQPGDEEKTTVPSMPDLSNLNANRDAFYKNSQALIDKGDHIRLQDISLSYDLGDLRPFKKTFKQVQLYGYANNIGILWRANKDGLDPDVYSVGWPSYPTPRTYALGLKLNF